MSVQLNRDVASDLYLDLSGNYRTVFNVASDNEEDNKALYNLLYNFKEAHGNDNIFYWMQNDVESPFKITRLEVMVGYSQAFETEFNNTFN